MSLLRITGGPELEGDIGSGVEVLSLPRADFQNFMQAGLRDETEIDFLASGLVTISGGGAINRRAFRFGYRDAYYQLGETDLQRLVEMLTLRVVTFRPRTLAAGDSGDAGDVETVLCRVTSPVPYTRHITRGFLVSIELEEMAAPVPVVLY